jgi:hypothetical protein
MFAILRLMALPAPAGVEPALRARVQPTSDRRDRFLPLLPALRPLFPGDGLERGSVVVVDREAKAGGATTLAFSLLAAATSAGWWCAAVGTADVGVLALAEMGIDLGRLLLVPRPGAARWAQATALAIDGTDAVLACPPSPVRPQLARRLTARARQRQVALVVLARHGTWPEGADLRLRMGAGCWLGAGAGHGHLAGRRVEVVSGGRRGADRPVRSELWLPSATGCPAA